MPTTTEKSARQVTVMSERLQAQQNEVARLVEKAADDEFNDADEALKMAQNETRKQMVALARPCRTWPRADSTGLSAGSRNNM